MSKLETNTIDNISGSSTLTIGETNTTTVNIDAATINLKNGSTTGLIVDSNGYPLKPNLPAFKIAWASSTSTNTIISTNNGFSQQTGRDEFNQGSHFNAANGRFTCPVAGVYYLGFSLMRNSSNGATHDIRLIKNGSSSSCWGRAYNASPGNFQQIYFSTITDAAANDYFQFFKSTTTTLYNDDTYTFGYLIG